MDAATIKGVVDRLVCDGLLETLADPDDKRRLIVALTLAGAALKVSRRTLELMTAQEQAALLARLT